MNLRPYQVTGVDAVRARARAGARRILCVAPTGSGKTVIAAAIIRSAIAKGRRALFVAHRREILRQTFAKLVRAGIPAEQIGIVLAGIELPRGAALFHDVDALSDAELWDRYARRRPNAPVQVGSIDTIRARALRPEADLVIYDECHRSLARSFRELAAHYVELPPEPGAEPAAEPAPKRAATLLGLTATPYRADGRGLGELYESLVVVASPRQLIAEGYLVEPHVWAAPRPPDLSRVRMKGSDYAQDELAETMNTAALVGDVVTHWQRHAAGVRTVVFATSVAHSQSLALRFREAGVAAEHLDGNTPTADRDAILARLERGETLVVSSCGVLCEGWDQPSVKCAVLARPTKSTGLYLQMSGRILRPWQGQQAVILDHAGAVYEHGFPTDDREYSLDKKNKRRAGAPVKTCPSCYAIVASATRACPSCGHVWDDEDIAKRAAPEERDGELVEVRPLSEDELRAAHATLVDDWRAYNRLARRPRRPGWVWVEFARRYHRRPPDGCRTPADDPEHAERRARVDAAGGGWRPRA